MYMRLVICLMRGLHNVGGISAPKPQDKAKVMLIWIGLLVIILRTALLGYAPITQIASRR